MSFIAAGNYIVNTDHIAAVELTLLGEEIRATIYSTSGGPIHLDGSDADAFLSTFAQAEGAAEPIQAVQNRLNP